MTSRRYARAGEQRLESAKYLLDGRYTLDSFYLAGYAIECSLKSLIVHLSSLLESGQVIDLGRRQISPDDLVEHFRRAAMMHHLEVLAGFLKALGRPVPPAFIDRSRRFGWSTAVHYESGHLRTGRARGFHRLAREIQVWASGEIR